MTSARRWIFALAVVAVVFSSLLLAGCGKKGQRTTSLDDARSQYVAGRYAAARRSSENALRDPAVRAEAAYLASLSTYQLGDLEDAERFALMARDSRNSRTVARANAMLGLIWLEWQHDVDAARALEAAHAGLSGHDAQQAARHAAIAHQRLNNVSAADHWNRLAQSTGSTANANTARRTNSEFSLQIGAFRELNRARTAAHDAESIAAQHGLAPVRIVSKTDASGVLIHIVQFGRFHSRSAANRARHSIGKLNLIVAPVVSS